jgi:alpha-tubulin suppressor-like RCC1 family protein
VAWGYSGSGQTTIPTGLSGVVAVAAGADHSLALKADGAIVAWGSNGDGRTTTPSGLSGVVAVAAGGAHNLALKADGTVVAWGGNADGQTAIPSGLGGVVAVAGGNSFGVFLRARSGDLAPSVASQPASLARNRGGRVTFSVGANFGTAPTTYQWRKAGAAIAGATSSTYTIDEVLVGSAGNYDVVVTNYLGSVTSSAATLTVNSSPVVNATDFGRYVLTPGQSTTLTLDPVIAAGAAVQWRKSGFAIAGATNRSLSLAQVAAGASGYYQAVYNDGSGAVTSAPIFVLVVPTSTQLLGWGSNSLGQLAFPLGVSNIAAVAARSFSSTALRSDGTVITFGSFGSSLPTGLGNVAAVAVGDSYCLALKADGTVIQWGETSNGQASPPADLANVVAIACGQYHSLALKRDGTVVAWGNSAIGATAVPVGLSGVVGISAGYGFSLALKSDGTVVGWGSNGSGQSSPPAGLSDVVAVSAGASHSMALKSDGTVVAWGTNASGQRNVPAGLAGVVAISAGRIHNLAVKSDGTVVAWGADGDVQTSVPVGLNSVIAVAGGGWHSLALRDSTGDVAPAITTQPASATAFVGQDIALSVAAERDAPPPRGDHGQCRQLRRRRHEPAWHRNQQCRGARGKLDPGGHPQSRGPANHRARPEPDAHGVGGHCRAGDLPVAQRWSRPSRSDGRELHVAARVGAGHGCLSGCRGQRRWHRGERALLCRRRGDESDRGMGQEYRGPSHRSVRPRRHPRRGGGRQPQSCPQGGWDNRGLG